MFEKVFECIDESIEMIKAEKVISTNEWIYGPLYNFYIRVTKRCLDGDVKDTIDLANITIHSHSKGLFTEFLEKLENEYPDRIIFVESITDGRFMRFFKRKGYIIEGEPGLWNAWKNINN